MAAQVCGLRPQIGEAWRRTEKFARNCRGKSEPWVCLDRPVWFARDSALEGDGFEPSVPPPRGRLFRECRGSRQRQTGPVCRYTGSQNRILTIAQGRFTVRRARLAPAMISTPGQWASRRRRRGARQPGRYSALPAGRPGDVVQQVAHMRDTAIVRHRVSNTMACQYFFCPAPTRSRPCKGADFWSGKSSTNRWLMAKSSDESVRRMGSRAISVASASAARALGRGVSRAACSQGSRPRRVKAETTLSVTPFCYSPTAAKRKSFRSEWSSENRAGSAMIDPASTGWPPE